MNFTKTIKINSIEISESAPVFIIAEAGVNHNGDMSIAKKLIDVAAEAGADAVKFQTFKAENLILDNVEKAPYQKGTTDAQQSQFEMLKSLEVTKEQNLELKRYCESKKIIFLTTPFDEGSLESLDELGLAAYKVASTDTTNLPFLEKIAKKGKPIFLSTGMTYLSEISQALSTLYRYNRDIILLQCTANYPIADNEANLGVIKTMMAQFDMLVGYSDHSVGVGAAPFAVPMGVKVVEKHFTLDKSQNGPDHLASLSPDELIDFVKTIRRVERYMGDGIKIPTLSEQKTRVSLQKCLVANVEITKGEQFSKDNLIAKRTGGVGISPLYIEKIVGTIAKRDFNVNEIIEV